ncbi:phosphoribosylaminoimidazolesuccinocarboxamide synthase [Methanobacterium alcaliphilum]|uniref:phosphoribosylaminoimidazolesuccinocarboxamide synthase n=1 Tax=Methanobacterium alcaliphilum TaxID=392018 RepID=UPI00200A0CBE|nr:phosphoribosylaminoimidazolesuccinocarboxamide synthase [Methanobacterium alcaliphilum]MCK9151636.1 phosphoribosylaminoimidazolesuccinocarboxamide synthase [Methanobacterium alcaliphilum]
MSLKLGKLIYTGKAKDVYETENPDRVIVKFRDDITAGDGEKKDILQLKGYYNSLISSKLFEVLEAAGIKTQYIGLLEPGYMLAHKLEMISLEVITRNIAAGSLLRRFPFEERQVFEKPIIQMDYKSDEYKDPMLNDDIAMALGLITAEELNDLREITLKINKTLKDFLETKGIILPDFKIEFGYDCEKNIVLGDEISPDTCRYWDIETWDVLDKDLFRQGDSGVMDAYKKVASMVLDDEDLKKWGLNEI